MDYNDYPDEEWVDDEQQGGPEDDVLLCPNCRESVHEDTQQCPHCGDWITPVWPGAGTRQWAWYAIALALIVGLLMMTVLY